MTKRELKSETEQEIIDILGNEGDEETAYRKLFDCLKADPLFAEASNSDITTFLVDFLAKLVIRVASIESGKK